MPVPNPFADPSAGAHSNSSPLVVPQLRGSHSPGAGSEIWRLSLSPEHWMDEIGSLLRSDGVDRVVFIERCDLVRACLHWRRSWGWW
ncbi:MAG: hypothetical protein CL912_09640 [Deltaproteobacteria bacterium]|nr:hypothetical protein [Deltaproteobacteria bacterium]